MTSHTTKDFWKLFDALPEGIQRQAKKSYQHWRKNPSHPALHFKPIHNVESIYSIRISHGYRSLGLREHATMTWFWIGSHQEYEKLISRL